MLERRPFGVPVGLPLLFVHGAWHGAWCWERFFLDYFAAQGFSAHALDLRDHGPGPAHRRRGNRIAHYVADVAAAVDTLGGSAVLIGHSMGGFVLQKYLERYRAPGVVLLASVPPQGVLATTLRIVRRFPLNFLRVNLTQRLYPLVESQELCRRLFLSESADPAICREVADQVVDESYFAFLDMLALDLPRVRQVPPMLVLGGDTDQIFTVPEVERTATRYGAELKILPDMAHDMMLEAGWRGAADEIIGWLRRRGMAGPAAAGALPG